MKLFRSFIAFELPNEAKNYCISARNDLISKNIEARWVKPENLHITVIFLKNRSHEELLSIAENINFQHIDLSTICFKVNSFNTFGSVPKILCLQLADAKNAASKIVDNILSANNLHANHSKWIPHITLARFKTLSERDSLKKRNLDNNIEGFQFSPESLNVFTSTLTPTGPIYHKVCSK